MPSAVPGTGKLRGALQCVMCDNTLLASRPRDPTRATCSKRCRSALDRALARGEDPGAEFAEVGLAAREMALDNALELATDAVKAEVGKLARNAITDELVDAVRRAASLLPATIDALAEALQATDVVWGPNGESERVPDHRVRLQAVKLLHNATLHHEAFRPAREDARAAGVTVVFEGMPRPAPADAEAPVDAEVVDAPEMPAAGGPVRTCDACGARKPAADMVGASARCTACHEAMWQQARDVLGDDDQH